MDISEAFRAEDLTKADFFDFVVAPETGSEGPQFPKQMRGTVNAFLGGGGGGASVGGLLPDVVKETNNNHMVGSAGGGGGGDLSSLAAAPTDAAFDLNFWADKDTVRLETAILEDLNKYCWSTGDEEGGKQPDAGHIYTLTVLNGIDQSANWYQPGAGGLGQRCLLKEEDAPHLGAGEGAGMDHLQPAIDIDSILSIMPPQMGAAFGVAPDAGPAGPGSGGGGGTPRGANTDGHLAKSETYTYEDSGFADHKDELASSLIIDTPLLETHDGFTSNAGEGESNDGVSATSSAATATSTNNNDWKLANNNQVNGSADSLLRSALQGKSFLRYNGKKGDAELRRVLAGKQPTIAQDGGLFEQEEAAAAGVDDLLLSQLDQHYADDFEKLKRIANEVAESVNQFCHLEAAAGEPVYVPIAPPPPPTPAPAPLVTSTNTSNSSKPPTKKYKRASTTSSASSSSSSSTTSSSSSASSASSSTSSSSAASTLAAATNSSNGVRKERSLHYCSICSKGFKDKYSVNVHIRTHTGEKPFACSLCGKSFRQKAHLAKHYQTHIAQKNAAAGAAGSATKAKAR